MVTFLQFPVQIVFFWCPTYQFDPGVPFSKMPHDVTTGPPCMFLVVEILPVLVLGAFPSGTSQVGVAQRHSLWDGHEFGELSSDLARQLKATQTNPRMAKVSWLQNELTTCSDRRQGGSQGCGSGVAKSVGWEAHFPKTGRTAHAHPGWCAARAGTTAVPCKVFHGVLSSWSRLGIKKPTHGQTRSKRETSPTNLDHTWSGTRARLEVACEASVEGQPFECVWWKDTTCGVSGVEIKCHFSRLMLLLSHNDQMNGSCVVASEQGCMDTKGVDREATNVGTLGGGVGK